MIPSFIACDTETGGLYPAVNPLLSIAAVSSASQADPFLVYVDPASQPGTWIEAEAARVNGYTPELWKQRGEVPLNEAMGQFRDWLAREKRKGGRIVCHNLAFDRGFLMEAERITGIDLPGRYDWRCSLLEMATQMDRGLINAGACSLNRLGDLSGFWKKEERAAKHDALQDAQACMHGWGWLIENAQAPVVDAEASPGDAEAQRLLDGLIRLGGVEDAAGDFRVTLEYDNYQDGALVIDGDGNVLAECYDLLDGPDPDSDPQETVRRQYYLAIGRAIAGKEGQL